MKQMSKLIDPFQIIGFVISTFISIILIVSGQDQISSIILGLVLTIITQLFDLQIRLSSSEARLLTANSLSKQLATNQWLLERINEIVNDYQEINRFSLDPFDFNKRKQESIIVCCNNLRDMANGSYRPDRIPLKESMVATQKAKKEIKAVHTGDLNFWQSPYAEKYINLNAQIINKGIKVTRIFILTKDNISQGIKILEKQRSLGVDIYLADPEELPEILKDDYLLIDDSFTIISEFGSDGNVRDSQISISKIEVARMINNFNQLLRYAQKLDEVTP